MQVPSFSLARSLRWVCTAAVVAVGLTGCNPDRIDHNTPSVFAPRSSNFTVEPGQFDIVTANDVTVLGTRFISGLAWKTGTGNIHPFLGIQSNGSERGFNTDGSFTYDQTRSNWTNPLPLNWVPVISKGGVSYRELILDANEANSGIAAYFSLDTLDIYLCDDPNAKTYSQFSDFQNNALCKRVYNLQGQVGLATDGKTNGSGNSLDYDILIPETNFSSSGLSKLQSCHYNPAAADCGLWVIVKAKMGGLAGDWVTGSTYEEFATIERPFVTVAKTAVPNVTRTYKWQIQKSVTPDIVLFNGQSAPATWSITVSPADPAYVDSDASVSGSVTITNPYTAAVLVTSISDDLTGYGAVSLTCPNGTTNVTIDVGANYVCTYSVNLGAAPAGTLWNKATAVVDVGAGYDGSVFVDSVSFAFGAPNTEVDKNPNIYDNYNGAGETLLGAYAGLTFPVTYQKTYTCGQDAGQYSNVARVDLANGTDPTATATLNVKCLDLTVAKTAATSLTRTYKWTIDKSVTPATWNLFNGDQGTSKYGVTVTPNGYDDNTWAVAGNITITNPNTVPVYLTGVTDAMTGPVAGVVSCPQTFPYTLAASGSLVCTYSATLPDGTNRTNTASVTAKPTVSGTAKTFTGDAAVSFAGVVLTEVNKTINVNDAYEGGAPTALGTRNWADGAHTFNYNRTFACNANSGTHGNVAEIVETSQTANASVTVNCYALSVAKTAVPAFERKWTWGIAKAKDSPDELTLALDQPYVVNYVVTPSVSSAESNFRVSGAITVTNPAPMAATLTGVSDLISGGVGAVAVSCPASTIDAAGSLVCTYEKSLGDKTALTNTATATRQAYAYAFDLTPTTNGTVDYVSSGVAITFGEPTEKVDECVNVSDTNPGTNVTGKICAGDMPVTFNYARTLTYSTCGLRQEPNTASFITVAGPGGTATGTTGSASQNIVVNVPCPSGCTLTLGYWKTHNDSFKGGARTDATWDLITPLKELSGFFTTASSYPMAGPNNIATPFTWFSVFWTAPSGNPYYNLARQYMAVKLNILNAAQSTPAVDAAIASAEALFAAMPPSTNWTKDQKQNLTSWASLFDSYNNGKIGPPHCSEDKTSAP